jgi:hypothetical protein
MSALLKTGLLCMACLLPLVAYGQGRFEVPLGALPMQYNGGFAGEAGSPRLNTVVGGGFNRNVNKQYADGGYRTYAAYDQFVPAIRSGIGVTAGYSHFDAGDRQLESYYYRGWGTYFAVAVAPKFSMGGKVTLSPSIDAAFFGSRNSFSNLSGYSRDSRNSAIQSRIGLLLNTQKFYVGYSIYLVDHFSTYQKDDTASLRMAGRREKFTSYWQLGYTFGRGTESKFSFTPQLVFSTATDRYARRGYRPFSFADFNLNFRYKKLIWGVNVTGVHLGWQTERLRIMLSDNLQYVRRDESGYAANVALRYVFKE